MGRQGRLWLGMGGVLGVLISGVDAQSDFGDFSGFGSASSLVLSTLSLGPTPDAEPAGGANASATGDDDQQLDDEAAVIWHANPSVGSSFPIYVETKVLGAAGYLNVWIDFDGNGLLNGNEELVVRSVRVAQSGWFGYNVKVPLSARTGVPLGMRVRMTSTSNPGPTGASGYGEVEDHLITIEPVAGAYRFRVGDQDGDLVLDPFSELEPLQPYGLVYGTDASVLADLDVHCLPGNETLMVDVTYEERNGREVEGLWLVLTAGGTPRTNNSAILYLDAFDPMFPKLTVYRYDSTQSEASWSSPGLLMLSSLPGRLNAGDVKQLSAQRDGQRVRFQFTLDTRRINDRGLWPGHGLSADWQGLKCLSTAGIWLHGVDLMAPPNYDGAGKLASWDTHPWPFGQVFLDSEFDGPVVTEPDPLSRDYGDFVGFFPASAEVSDDLRLGFLVDAEAVPLGDGAATADDVMEWADEDGLLTMDVLEQGRSYTVDLPVTNASDRPAYFSLWMDWNGDGHLNGLNEQVVRDRMVPAGTVDGFYDLTFRVPPNALVRTTLGLRLRLSSLPGAGPVGAYAEGEVEDSVFTVKEAGAASPLGLGNLVFLDDNENGRADEGEGVPGVVLHLLRFDQLPGVDLPLAEAVSGSDGEYGFTNLDPGLYYVHIPATQFRQGGPLFQKQSIAEGLAGDDDVGEDGVNWGEPYWDGVSSGLVALQLGQAPTTATGETGFKSGSDNANDAAVDLTVDFGFQSPMGIGNLVFFDANGSGAYDAGEGVPGVRVEVYRADQQPGSDFPLAVEITDEEGRYGFDSLTGGEYIVHIPASEFDWGGPLEGWVSMPGVSIGTDDDVGEDGHDDWGPHLNGIQSGVVRLSAGMQPTLATGETGAFAEDDNGADDQSDLTVDFGFVAYDGMTLGVGNGVYLDLNGNGTFDWDEGVDGVPLQLFRATDDPQVDVPVMETVTAAGGFYLLTTKTPGAYVVHIPAEAFAPGQPLAGMMSVPGVGGDFGLDDDVDENGNDATQPEVTGVTSTEFVLGVDAEPVDWNGEFGQGYYQDSFDDDNVDLTIDFGFSANVGVGNLVFEDLNGNGGADEGEGVPGVMVQLFAGGMDPYFHEPVAETITDGEGGYLFGGLAPGLYFLFIPPWEFGVGGALAGQISLAGHEEGDDDVGEDGIDTMFPFFDGVRTETFELSAGLNPVGAAESGWQGEVDNDRDGAADLTRDFGFQRQAFLGDGVFLDLNGDGVMDRDGLDNLIGTGDDEVGLPGVTMEIWQPGADGVIGGADDVQIQSFAWTLEDGGYVLGELSPGVYYVKIPAVNFSSGGPLVQWPVVSQVASERWFPGQDANVGVQPGGPGADVYGPLVEVESGDERRDIDFGFRASEQPGTFLAWQQLYADPSRNAPEQDFDGDMMSNLEEFAFGLAGNSGFRLRRGEAAAQCPLRLEVDAATQRVDLYTDRVAALVGVTFVLEGIADLKASPDGWMELEALVPEVVSVEEGIEQVCYRGVNLLSMFAAGTGAVRIRVRLDEDLDGTPEAEVVTLALGWLTMPLTPTLRTGSSPFAGCTVFSGQVTVSSGAMLTFADSVATGQDTATLIEPGASYYLEVATGSEAGHRLEIDEANTFGQHWALDLNHPLTTLKIVGENLVGLSVRVRRHQQLGQLFDPGRHTAAFSSMAADRLLFFNSTQQSFQTYWLFAHPEGAYWVLQGDGALENRNTHVVTPLQGYFTQVRQPTVQMVYCGEVRDHAVVNRLEAGAQLIGFGWPVSGSPQDGDMKVSNGFNGSSSSSQADQLMSWVGDQVLGQSGYRSYFLLSSGSFRYWVEVGDGTATNHDESLLFQPARALFLRARKAKDVWQIPCPWTP